MPKSPAAMTPALRQAINELRLAGYAVVVFSPSELDGGVEPRTLEKRLVELGNEAIDTLRERA